MFREAISLMQDRLNELNTKLNEFKKEYENQIKEKEKEIKNVENAIKELEKIQADYDREQRNLAVQKGVCPFPKECNERDYCTKDRCNADVCSNGYAYRMS